MYAMLNIYIYIFMPDVRDQLYGFKNRFQIKKSGEKILPVSVLKIYVIYAYNNIHNNDDDANLMKGLGWT